MLISDRQLQHGMMSHYECDISYEKNLKYCVLNLRKAPNNGSLFYVPTEHKKSANRRPGLIYYPPVTKQPKHYGNKMLP